MTDTKLHIQKAQRTLSRMNILKIYLGISYSNCRKPIKKIKYFKKAEEQTRCLQRNRHNNYIGLLFTIHASKKC